EWRLVLRYPVRLAFNPLVSTIGWYLPLLFSGSLIVATVMNLPNIGPLLLRALVNQDMYLAGGILLIYSFLTVVGTLLSDVALALIDPRIRVGRCHDSGHRRRARGQGCRRFQLEAGVVALSSPPPRHGQRGPADRALPDRSVPELLLDPG